MSKAEEFSLSIKEIPAATTWNIRHEVMWPNKPLSYVQLPKDDHVLHFGLYHQEQLVAVVSLFIEGSEAQFRKLATITTQQGKGYGSLLLSHLINYCNRLDIQRIWCNARADKQAFYLKRGITPTTATFSKDGMKYLVMEKRFASHS